MKLLVVAAWEPELTRFRERCSAATELRKTLALETLGVGMVEAAIGMTQCIARHAPSLALLLGTGGGFKGKAALGGVVVASRVHLLEASVAAGHAALPGPMPDEVVLDAGVHDALVAAGGRSVQIANTVGMTVDDDLASRLGASRGDDVEHLEAFAFARACAVAGVRCGIVLGVANIVGSRGRSEWLANHTSASASAAEVAWRALPALAALVRTTTTAPSPERA